VALPLSLILSAVAGYVDTVGFLALQGLFTAHVTGNFVTIGAALIGGTSGIVAKLLALPVFCIVVIATRLASEALSRRGRPALRCLLGAQLVLLALGAALAVPLHPSASADSAEAILTGLVFVAAMGVQNAAHRVYLVNAPPSTLMTGTTTQVMLDVADLLHGRPDRPVAKPRLWRMIWAIAVFAAGCAAGAGAFAAVGNLAFGIPVFAILLALFADEAGLKTDRGVAA
jgi:uncharacterized membrane protein YoaK (UPF0700 family)